MVYAIDDGGIHIIGRGRDQELARAGRKQIFVTRKPTVITMIFRTDAQTVEQAEAEFTDEAELLMSRQSDSDLVLITGA